MYPTHSPISVAIVDDHIVLRRSVKTYLGNEGFSIALEAEHGQALLSALECLKELPDICLLDINMPVMDGFATAVQLKTRFPAIRIMAYSSFNDRATKERIMRCGADEFVCKDALPHELKASLEGLFNKQHISSQALYSSLSRAQPVS